MFDLAASVWDQRDVTMPHKSFHTATVSENSLVPVVFAYVTLSNLRLSRPPNLCVSPQLPQRLPPASR
jgi:hypothetical protein